jgi:MFS family permease
MNAQLETLSADSRSPMVRALAAPAFRWFWLVSAVSMFGDQLSMIALPWLVLKLTGDAAAMGFVIALAAVPRALFMLIGGALTDRLSPRRLLVVTNLLRLVTMGLVAFATWRGTVNLDQIYLLAFVFGLADAFAWPAQSAMPPRLLPPADLGGGNALLQGTAQLSLVIAPALAGVLIALDLGGATPQLIKDQQGLALVFGLNTFSFLFAAVVLAALRETFSPPAGLQQSMLSSMFAGLRHVWGDVPLRDLILLLALFSVVFRGPFAIGIPALANRYLTEGAAGFGVLMSALGIGSIVGTLLAGFWRGPQRVPLGALMLADFLNFGTLLVVASFIQVLWPLALLIGVFAIVDALLVVYFTTWLQLRVPGEFLGRVSSVLMFFNLGLFPLSSAVAGVLADANLLGLLGVSGALLVLIALAGFTMPGLRTLGRKASTAE